MAAIQRYGLKKRHLNKFEKHIDRFYSKRIDGREYESDLVCKYQERFVNYKGKLFTFLKHDNVLWHNNPSEHALRHIILQSDVSRRFSKSMIEDYLVLLGIKQTCKFQNKSFLKFLLSNETDVSKLKCYER